MSAKILSDEDLNQIFRAARTYSAWTKEPVSDILLQAAYDLARMGPTAANSCPMRVVFVRTPEAKERLRPAILPSNMDKVMTAPVTAIIGQDTEFYETLPRLFPHTDARSWYIGNKPLITETAMRNSSLQAAYLIIALRAVGLDCGPMSGFDAAKVNDTFFPDGRVRANMLINIGHGDPATLHPRLPRLEFDEACSIL